MGFGDLSTFLPRGEGEKLNTEQARAEGEKRAAYLSSMDQFYEGLEETQRQFDIQQALASRQFEWMSGFEEKKLTEETRLADERLELERTQFDADLKLRREEQNYMQWLYGEQTSMAWQKFDLEKRVLEKELGPTGPRAPYGMATHSAFSDRTGGMDAWWRQGNRGGHIEYKQNRWM